MNVQDFANVGEYLREFMSAINRKAAVAGFDAFTVEVRETSITDEEAALLR